MAISDDPDYVEIMHLPDALSIVTLGCEIRAWNDKGDELPL